jgi:hypothetical protein
VKHVNVLQAVDQSTTLVRLGRDVHPTIVTTLGFLECDIFVQIDIDRAPHRCLVRSSGHVDIRADDREAVVGGARVVDRQAVIGGVWQGEDDAEEEHQEKENVSEELHLA